MSNKLEKVQRQALRIVYGPNTNLNELIDSGKIETLKTRREKKCLDFAIKASVSERFGSKWFCKNRVDGREVRDTTRKRYVERFTRNERMKNNPICYMTRLLNENENITQQEQK